MERLLYSEVAQIVRESTEVVVHEECNGWVAVNKGQDIAVINGIQLFPPLVANTTGDSVSIGGNVGELYNKKTIKVVFESTTQPYILIIQKIYAKRYIDENLQVLLQILNKL